MLMYHYEFLCAHQCGVDRESSINDGAIREEALKSDTFQLRNRKPSELQLIASASGVMGAL